MTIEIKAPSFPESVTDGTIATWYKKPGEACLRDELIADIETDKVVIIGASVEVIHDVKSTPFYNYLGHTQDTPGMELSLIHI